MLSSSLPGKTHLHSRQDPRAVDLVFRRRRRAFRRGATTFDVLPHRPASQIKEAEGESPKDEADAKPPPRAWRGASPEDELTHGASPEDERRSLAPKAGRCGSPTAPAARPPEARWRLGKHRRGSEDELVRRRRTSEDLEDAAGRRGVSFFLREPPPGRSCRVLRDAPPGDFNRARRELSERASHRPGYLWRRTKRSPGRGRRGGLRSENARGALVEHPVEFSIVTLKGRALTRIGGHDGWKEHDKAVL